MKDRSSAGPWRNERPGYFEGGEDCWAWVTIDLDGSMPNMRLKCGDRERGIAPWPQPRSTRKLNGAW